METFSNPPKRVRIVEVGPREIERRQREEVGSRPAFAHLQPLEPRRKTGTCAKHQRDLASAVKRARNIAILPYVGGGRED